jgi:hypothetical protein
MTGHRRRGSRWLVAEGVAVLALGALAWLARGPRDPSAGASPSPAGRDGLRHLEATVKEVEPGRDGIALAHGLLGLDVTRLRLDRQTAITVGDKEGGVGDLRDGRRVRVTYQVGPHGAVARSIAVLVPAGADVPPAPAGAASPAPPADPAAPRDAPSSGPREAAGSGAGPTETASPPRSPKPEVAAEAPPRAVVGRPADPAEVPRGAASRVLSEPSPPGPRQPDAAGARGPEATGRRRSADEDPDPTAVVDWLLKEYSARRP